MPSPPPSEGALGAAVREYARALRDPAIPLPERIRYGAEAWEAIAALGAALEALKEELRAAAAPQITEGGRALVEFTGRAGARATVKFGPKAYRPRGVVVNPVEALQRLGPAGFNRVFRLDLRDGLTPDSLDPGETAYLERIATLKCPTARVAFENMVGVTPVG